MCAHAINDRRREHDFRVTADRLGAIGEAIGIDARALPPYDPGSEQLEIPFGSAAASTSFKSRSCLCEIIAGSLRTTVIISH